MFTGIVEELGTVAESGDGFFRILASKVLGGTKVGDSIAVNGICLTVTSMDGSSFSADVMPETLRKTSLAFAKPGSHVDLERAAALGERIGGHIVSGHIDGTGVLRSMRPEGNAIWMEIDAEAEILKYIIERGSVTIDGISLTVVSVGSTSFTVSLIPHTREVTVLGEREAGDRVNIETDMIGRYVERFVHAAHSDTPEITKNFLLENGF